MNRAERLKARIHELIAGEGVRPGFAKEIRRRLSYVNTEKDLVWLGRHVKTEVEEQGRKYRQRIAKQKVDGHYRRHGMH